MKLSCPRLPVLFTPKHEMKIFGENRHIDSCWGKDIGLVAAIAGSVVDHRIDGRERLETAIGGVGARWYNNFTYLLASIAKVMLIAPNHNTRNIKFLPAPGNLAEMFSDEYGQIVFGKQPTREALFGKDLGLIMLLAQSRVEASDDEADQTATAVIHATDKWGDDNHHMIIDLAAQALIQLKRTEWPQVRQTEHQITASETA